MFDAQVKKLDAFQQQHSWLGFPMAVLKKFGEDQGGNLAAVLSYYAFFSLFPLVAVFVTLLGFVLESAPTVRAKVQSAVTSQFSNLAPQSGTFDRIHGSWWVLVIGVLAALWSGLAVANAAQTAFNGIYDVAYADRPDFIHRVGRSVVIVLVGFLLLATTVVAGYISAPLGTHAPGAVSKTLSALVSVALDFGLFLFLFQWLTARKITWRQALPGAVIAAVAFAVLQVTATTLITHYAQGAKQATAAVGAVIGILSWFYLQARITLLAAAVNVVLQFKLWPRAMRQPPGTAADKKAYQMQAEEARFRKDEDVDVELTGESSGAPASTDESPTRAGTKRAAGTTGTEGAAVHSPTSVHRGRVVALVVGTGLAAWVHGRKTALPSTGESNEHQSRHVGRQRG